MSLRKSSNSKNGSKSEVLPKPKARRRCTPAPSMVGLALISFRIGRMDTLPFLSHPDPHRSETPVLIARPAATGRESHPWRLWILLGLGLIVLAVIARFAGPMVLTALNTVSTDDAYVNGHVTFVAPRVAGQVMKVLVDDNYRVKKGDLLVELDKEPYQVQLAIKQAAVTAADS